MKREDIKNEIIKLKKLNNDWSRTNLNKNQANDLVSKIKVFKHTLSVEFPNSVNHYIENRYAEIHITDGISELEQYSQSKLKKKDDIYFYEGLKNMNWGIEKIITDLEIELEKKIKTLYNKVLW